MAVTPNTIQRPIPQKSVILPSGRRQCPQEKYGVTPSSVYSDFPRLTQSPTPSDAVTLIVPYPVSLYTQRRTAPSPASSDVSTLTASSPAPSDVSTLTTPSPAPSSSQVSPRKRISSADRPDSAFSPISKSPRPDMNNEDVRINGERTFTTPFDPELCMINKELECMTKFFKRSTSIRASKE